jgi:hypothetical protein
MQNSFQHLFFKRMFSIKCSGFYDLLPSAHCKWQMW